MARRLLDHCSPKRLVNVAEKEGAVAVAHGCTGKGNDQVRFDVTVKAMNPDLKIIAPVREWNMNREDEIKYAQKNHIPIKVSNSIFSIDQNLWGRSIESGPLEDPFVEPPEEAFEWCVPAKNAPDNAEYLEIEFEKGVPVAVDGKKSPPVDLIRYVNQKAGLNGFGIVDHVEDRLVGIKSREVYKCPAALTLNRSPQGSRETRSHETRAFVQVQSRGGVVLASLLWVVDGTIPTCARCFR